MNFALNRLLLLSANNNLYCWTNCSSFLLNESQVEHGISKIEVSAVEDKTPVNNNISSGVLLVAFVLVIITTLLKLAEFNKNKARANNNSLNYQNNSPKDTLSPCKNCRFYNDNYYLNCAVNPTKVLKPEANECSDYSQFKDRFYR